MESLDNVVLTVGRASPVAAATSPAVNPRSDDSAASTLTLVSPGRVRLDEGAPFDTLAERAGVGFTASDVLAGRFAVGCDLVALGVGDTRSRGSSAARA